MQGIGSYSVLSVGLTSFSVLSVGRSPSLPPYRSSVDLPSYSVSSVGRFPYRPSTLPSSYHLSVHLPLLLRITGRSVSLSFDGQSGPSVPSVIVGPSFVFPVRRFVFPPPKNERSRLGKHCHKLAPESREICNTICIPRGLVIHRCWGERLDHQLYGTAQDQHIQA